MTPGPGDSVTHDDFASITDSAPLVAELRARIAHDGQITFRDFMAACLYHPEHGYYASHSGVTQRSGDFVTSPEVHPVFGAMVAKQLFEMWEVMDRPPSIDVVEAGAGSGSLARDIGVWAGANAADFARALRYIIVEPLASLQPAQQRTLSASKLQVMWTKTLPDRIDGCVLSNELLDSFPVHRVVRERDALREVYVAYDGGRFVDQLGALSDPALSAYFDDAGVLPGDGCYAETNLEAPRWIARVAAALVRGYVMTFDYGYETAGLYAPWRRDGTLLCFYRQSASSDPYQRIGKQDMTASVDFGALKRAGEAHGLATMAQTDQASFLVRMGIGEGVAQAAGAMEEYFARRRVLMDLIDPARLGRITVLFQGKDVASTPLRGFVDGA